MNPMTSYATLSLYAAAICPPCHIRAIDCPSRCNAICRRPSQSRCSVTCAHTALGGVRNRRHYATTLPTTTRSRVVRCTTRQSVGLPVSTNRSCTQRRSVRLRGCIPARVTTHWTYIARPAMKTSPRERPFSTLKTSYYTQGSSTRPRLSMHGSA